MGLFDQFPYTNFHELNLMWILEALKEIQTTTEQFVAINSLKYADPIQWNITKQYEKNTIVIDPLTGTAYISVQPVPNGVALTNEDYWTVVFDLGSFVTRAAQNFTLNWESQWTQTATFPSTIGSWLVWNDTLYKVISNIVAGDQYVIDSNIKRFTMEEYLGHLEDLDVEGALSIVNAINLVYESLLANEGNLEDLITEDKSNLVAALNEVATQVLDKIGDLDDLITTDKSNLVAAINEVATQVLGKIGDLDDLNTTDKSNLVAAINEVNTNSINGDAALLALIRGKIAIDATNPPESYLPIVADDMSIDNGARLEILINQFSYVYIPKGLYYVSTPINIINPDRCIISDNATLRIADTVTTKMNLFVVIPDDAGKDLFNISMHNITLDGNRTARGIANDLANNTLFLAFTHSQYDLYNIELDRVTFINSAGFCALFGGHENGGDLTQYFTRDIWVHGCIAHDNYGYIGTSGIDNGVFELCHLYNNECENLTFDNNSSSCTLRNSVIGTSNGGIGSVGIGVCRNCLIENNEFDYELNTAQLLPNYRNCITLKNTNNPAMTISIRNNTFKRATNAAIYIDYDNASAHSICAEIVNNVFNGCNKTIVNTAPADKGIIKCDMMLGQPDLPENTGNGDVILPPLFAVWRAVADSFVVSTDTFLNFPSSLIYHKLGPKNTYGIPAILFRGYYRIHGNVSFIASDEKRVAMRILLNGNVVDDTNMVTAIGMNSLTVDSLVLAQAGDSVQIFLINFDSGNTLTFELGRASIEYVGYLESNITDFATY